MLIASAPCASQTACERSDFDAQLGGEAQARLRASWVDEGEAMRNYLDQFSSPASPSFVSLLARADLCCARIEPVLASLQAADAQLAQRFPWHSAPDTAPDTDQSAQQGAQQQQQQQQQGGCGQESSQGQELQQEGTPPPDTAPPDPAAKRAKGGSST